MSQSLGRSSTQPVCHPRPLLERSSSNSSSIALPAALNFASTLGTSLPSCSQLDSLNILSELASSVLPASADSNDQSTSPISHDAFQALLLASLPQPVDYSPPFNTHSLFAQPDPIPSFLPTLDQHQHAQDLLLALSALQAGSENQEGPDRALSLFSSFANQPDNFDLLFAPAPSGLSQLPNTFEAHKENLGQETAGDAARERVFESLFSLEQAPPPFSPDDTDLLLASIDRHLNEDAVLSQVDQQTDAALVANEAYSARIRKFLEEVGRALERGEELELVANHYLNTHQQQTLAAPQPTQNVIMPVKQNTNNSESPVMLVAEGSYTLTLPWFKYKYGHDLPPHDDAIKRDRYNAILHQQAWQVGERRKLEEEVTAQLRSRPHDLSDTNANLDWSLVAQALPDRTPIECRIQWNQRQHPSLNRSKWTPDELDRLFEIAKRRKERDWRAIAAELATRRTAAECVKQYRMVTQERRDWTEADDLLLREGVSMYGQNWQAVAKHCSRSSNQCINRWSKTLRPDIKKGKWDPVEDEALRSAVAACGTVWKDVAPRVRGRTDAQCRERWCNILDPRIVVGNWTTDEDDKIIRLRNEHGKTWSEISRSFDGRRTDNHVSQCMRRYSELTKSALKGRKLGVSKLSSATTAYSSIAAATRRAPVVPQIPMTVPPKPPEPQKHVKPTKLISATLADRIQPELLSASSGSSLRLDLGKRAREDDDVAVEGETTEKRRCR